MFYRRQKAYKGIRALLFGKEKSAAIYRRCLHGHGKSLVSSCRLAKGGFTLFCDEIPRRFIAYSTALSSSEAEHKPLFGSVTLPCLECG